MGRKWSDVGELFVKHARARGIPKHQRNALISLITSLAGDQKLPENVRASFFRVSTLSLRAQSNFVTQSLNKHWPVEEMIMGTELPKPEEDKITTIAHLLSEREEPKPPPKENFVAAESQPSKEEKQQQRVVVGSGWTPEPIETVISVRLDNNYNAAEISNLIDQWLRQNLPGIRLQILSVTSLVSNPRWIDLKVICDLVYPEIRHWLVKLRWVETVISKPVSEFGQFWVCSE